MKHQYFGDINDYRKYGLLRGLTDAGNLSLAVSWMLTADTDGNVDGRKVSYLDNPNVFRHHDPRLFDLLRREVKEAGIRRVDGPALNEILPNTCFGDAPIPADITARKKWLLDFLDLATEAEILFFDPDNGMEVPSVARGAKDSIKYLYWDELAAAYARGHSVLVYQHFHRVQRKEFIAGLSRKTREVTGACAILTYTTPQMMFLLICQKHHLRRFLDANQRIAHQWHSQIVFSSPSEIANGPAGDEIHISCCPFCTPGNSSVILGNEHAFAIYDRFPVTLGHSLIIPKRHVASFFDATADEQASMLELVRAMQQLLKTEHTPDGFNIGVNDGAAAGQTIMHLHIHLIPRYRGETADPRGGVRWVVPEKAPYWTNS